MFNFDFLFCCCTDNTSSTEEVGMRTSIQKVGLTGDIFDSATDVSCMMVPAASGKPLYQHMREDSVSTRCKSPVSRPSIQSERAENDGSLTARSNVSRASSLTPEEKEREKARLQRLVKDFAKESVHGFSCTLLDAKSGEKVAVKYQMDRYLTYFTLTLTVDGVLDEIPRCSFHQFFGQDGNRNFGMRDITAVYKGRDTSRKIPELREDWAMTCVGVDIRNADTRFIFTFPDTFARDKFYTCLKILRMSVDLGKSAPKH